MANIPTPWTPPALDAWNFTDCTLYSQYASNIYRTTKFNRYNLCEADDDGMYEYLKSGLTSDILNSTAVPSPEEASAWYQDNCFNFAFVPAAKSESQRIIAKMITWDKKDDDGRGGLGPVIRTCRSELQSAMSIEGNADIAGVGVSRVSIVVSSFLGGRANSATGIGILRDPSRSHHSLSPERSIRSRRC